MWLAYTNSTFSTNSKGFWKLSTRAYCLLPALGNALCKPGRKKRRRGAVGTRAAYNPQRSDFALNVKMCSVSILRTFCIDDLSIDFASFLSTDLSCVF